MKLFNAKTSLKTKIIHTLSLNPTCLFAYEENFKGYMLYIQ